MTDWLAVSIYEGDDWVKLPNGMHAMHTLDANIDDLRSLRIEGGQRFQVMLFSGLYGGAKLIKLFTVDNNERYRFLLHTSSLGRIS